MSSPRQPPQDDDAEPADGDAAETRGAQGDAAPGDESIGRDDAIKGFKSYFFGLALALLLTAVSFYIAKSTLVWEPSIPIALSVLAMAQIGVHLVFFLHITTGKDNLNNAMALAFGVLIVMLLVFGSLWIMSNLAEHQMPMGELMKMQR